MNFKDRLELINTSGSFFVQKNDYVEVKNESDILDLFMRNNACEEVLSSVSKLCKNFVISSSIEHDKTIIMQYVKSFLPDDTVCKSTSDIKDIVSVFENILYGHNGFIFTINIKTCEYFLESLKTLISLNFPNVSDSGINNLLGLSDCCVIYVEKNDDGLFYISNISEITYEDGLIALNQLYTYQVEEPQEIPFEVYSAQEQVVEVEQIEDVEVAQIEDVEYVEETEQIQEVEETQEENIVETPEKVNKYKLLRDKVKNKKII